MKNLLVILFLNLLIVGCNSENSYINTTNQPTAKSISYLALGDSYTIGQSVCETCRFPIQLQDSLKKYLPTNTVFTTKIIATTGWTTSDLKAAIVNQNPSNNYDFVTLLIGVNNQYQNKPFSLYEQEFPELIATAVAKVNGKKQKVIVISIPDYAYTPFGNGNTLTSTQIAQYNNFAQYYCATNNITFVNITDITQQGLSDPALVAQDGLHPSALAYSKFVERLLPKAKIIVVK